MLAYALTEGVRLVSARREMPFLICLHRGKMKRVVAVNWDGKVLAPCGACRERMTQLMPESYRDIEVMLDYEKKEIVTFGELATALCCLLQN